MSVWSCCAWRKSPVVALCTLSSNRGRTSLYGAATGNSLGRAELTWPFSPFFFGKKLLFSVCDAGSNGRGEGNHSHILCLCALIHRGLCLYTTSYDLRQSRQRQERQSRGKQSLFIFLYICKGGTRVKERRLPPALCLQSDLI